MERADIEGTADALYRAAGFDTTEPIAPMRLARSLLGDGAVLTVRNVSLPGDAVLVRVGADWRIYLRAGASLERRRFAVAHELAEWHLARTGYRENDREEIADALGAALLAPRQLFLRFQRHTGARWPALAHALATSETCVALRHGEVTGEPLAVVAPRTLRVRGDDFVWPDAEQLRRLVAGRLPEGLRRDRLRDDPRRVVVRAA